MAAFIRSIMPQPMRRVRVNLNAINADGFIRVRASHADGSVVNGQLVQIFEPTDEIEGLAKVVNINPATGLMYLDVQWDTLRDLPPALESRVTQLGTGLVTDRSPMTWLRPAGAVAW